MKFTTLLFCFCLLTIGCANATPPKQPVSDEKDDPYVLMELFGAAYQVIKQDYVEETTDRKLVENAINGMLSSLDPHSGFMNQSDYADLFRRAIISRILTANR